MSCAFVVDNESRCFLQEAGKQLHIDPILSKALILLPSLHNVDQGGIGLHVEHPLKGAGSAWALDYATPILNFQSRLTLHISLNASDLAWSSTLSARKECRYRR